MTQQFGGNAGAQDPPGRKPTAGSGERLQEKAGRIGEQAVEQGKHAIEGQTRTLADKAGQLADSVRAAADNLEQQDNPELSRYLSSFASGVAEVADGLRNKNADDLLRDVNGLARRNPTMFVAGAVALGFALTRFARASSRRSHDDDYTFDQFEPHGDDAFAARDSTGSPLRERSLSEYPASGSGSLGGTAGSGGFGGAGAAGGIGGSGTAGGTAGSTSSSTSSSTSGSGRSDLGFASGSLGDSRSPGRSGSGTGSPLGGAVTPASGTRSAGGSGGGGAAGGVSSRPGSAGLHGSVDSTGAPRSSVGASRSPLDRGGSASSVDSVPDSTRRSGPNTTGGTPL